MRPFYNNTVILDQHYYNTILIQGRFHPGIKVLAWHIDMQGNKTKNIFECMYPTYMKTNQILSIQVLGQSLYMWLEWHQTNVGLVSSFFDFIWVYIFEDFTFWF